MPIKKCIVCGADVEVDTKILEDYNVPIICVDCTYKIDVKKGKRKEGDYHEM